MSLDFILYTSRARELTPPALGPAAQIAMQGPDKVEEEDISDPERAVIGKRRFAYMIHVEGVLEPDTRKLADGWLCQVIQDTKGVLIDLQSDRFETVSRSGQLAASEAPAPERLGGMSFHFSDGEAFFSEGFERMLSLMAEILPEALPARYGPHEPLQSKVVDRQLGPVIDAYHSDPGLILKAKAPFGHLLHSIPCQKTFETWHPRHFIRREFLLANVCLELRPGIFSDPAIWSRLVGLFESLCLEFDVIYAEISGSPAHRDAWFWYGLPGGTPQTICIGPDYSNVWPEAQAVGRSLGPHHLILETDRLGGTPPAPPPELLAPDNSAKNPGGKPDYAKVFPFDFTYDYDTYHW